MQGLASLHYSHNLSPPEASTESSQMVGTGLVQTLKTEYRFECVQISRTLKVILKYLVLRHLLDFSFYPIKLIEAHTDTYLA